MLRSRSKACSKKEHRILNEKCRKKCHANWVINEYLMLITTYRDHPFAKAILPLPFTLSRI